MNKQIGPYYSDIQTQTGSDNPVHATSSGKVLLAHSDDDTVDIILSGELEAFTEHTLVNPIRIRKQLEDIRIKGYSFSAEELTLGNYSIAAPVFNYDGEIVCAIALVGPMTRLTERNKDRFIRVLVRAAAEASDRLGYDG